MYSNIAAFFMTGTGNSYKVAGWFLAAFSSARTVLRQVKENQPAGIPADTDLVIFSYPTHGFTAPWLMIKYIFRLPAGSGTHAVVLPTRAGTRILGYAFPGMEGTAGYLIALLLWLRGYKVKAVSAVDMPSNWTAVHWGLNDENVQAIVTKARNTVQTIARRVSAGHSYYNGFIPLLLGLGLARISFMYIILAQFILAKLFFASDQCNGCALCRRICPKQALSMTGNKPHWSYSCDSCMACMNYCPQKAIQVSPLIVFLFAYVLSLPVAAWLSGKLGYVFMDLPQILQFVLQYMYTLLSVAAVYWLLHLILRIKPVAAVLASLSHTKYFRRYRAPGVSLKDIHK
ncbi:hypothetical protein SATMO3_16180 [Sporomusa aerivorans]